MTDSGRAQLAARLRALPFTAQFPDAPMPVRLSGAERDALLAALGAEAEPRGWQPFDSASKGEWILAWTDIYGIQKIAWINATWMTTSGADLREMGVTPTHWMPLPSPPAARSRRRK